MKYTKTKTVILYQRARSHTWDVGADQARITTLLTVEIFRGYPREKTLLLFTCVRLVLPIRLKQDSILALFLYSSGESAWRATKTKREKKKCNLSLRENSLMTLPRKRTTYWTSGHEHLSETRDVMSEQSPFRFPSCSQTVAYLQWWKTKKKREISERGGKSYKDWQRSQSADILQRLRVSLFTRSRLKI